MVGDRADPGQPQTDPCRHPGRSGRVEWRVGEHDPDTGPRRLGVVVGPPGRRIEFLRDHPSPQGQLVRCSEIGEKHHRDRRAVGQHTRRRADAPFPAHAHGPGTRAHTTAQRRPPAGGQAIARGTPRLCQGLGHVLIAHVHRARVVEPRIVTFPHDRDHDRIRDLGLLGHQQAAGSVIHAADLHRAGEEHRGLGHPPLPDLQAARQFTGAVEDRHTRRHRAGPHITPRIDHGHPGPCDAATGRRISLITHDRRVSQSGAGHVEN